MRRLLVVVALLVLALLAWLLLFRDTGPSGGAGRASGDPAANEEGAVTAKERKRAKPEAVPRAASVSDLLAEWPQIGQDREQDPKLASVTGRVLAAVGTPVAEAVVESAAAGEVTARVQTKPNGSFLLKNVPPGRSVSLTARAKDYAPGGCERLLLAAGQKFDVGVLYLGAALDPDATNRIEVKVLKSDDKGAAPVQGAVVTATSILSGQLVAMGAWEKQPGGSVVRVKTNAEGLAVFDRLPPAFYDFLAEADGLTFVARQQVLVQRDTRNSIQLELSAALTIEGKVVDEEGNPIADARVGVFRFANFTTYPATNSNADGTFSIGGLPAGTCMLFAAKAGRGRLLIQNAEAGRKDFVVTLPLGRTLAIKVIDGATGSPVTEYTARPFQNGPFAYLYAPGLPVKADDGVFRTPLDVAGSWGVEVSAPGYAVKSIASVQLDSKDPVEVKLDAAAVVHGRVVTKGDAKPIRGARVYIRRGGTPPSPSKDQQTQSDADGAFVLDGLATQAVKLTISHVDHTEESFDAEPALRGEKGALPPAVDFALSSGGRVSGHAFGPGRASLAGQQITLMKDFFSARRVAPIAADGAYEFKNVPPDKYLLTLGGGRGQRGDVEVTDGCDLTIDFGTEAGGQKVDVRVLRGEEAVAGLAVTLEGGGKTLRGQTDEQGRVTFESVPPGTYKARPSFFASSASVPVEVKAEEPPAEVTLQLPAIGSMELRVVDDSSGKPLAGAWVSFEQTVDAAGKAPDEIRAGGMQRPTGDDGVVVLNNMEAGRYLIRAWRDPYGSEMLEDVPLAAGEAKTGMEVRLAGAGLITGTAKNSAGQGIEGAAVHLKDTRGRSVFLVNFASTSADGSFTQAQVKPGTYDVTVEKDGYAPATHRVEVTLGKETRADFTLLMGGWIDVTALQADGTGLANATATLLDSAGRRVEKGLTMSNILTTSQTRTDSSGRISLRGIAPGSYVVKLRREDGTEATKPVDVVEGASAAVEIRFPAQ